jgi:5-methylcytosine-specific restriction endonuclease McrA
MQPRDRFYQWTEFDQTCRRYGLRARKLSDNRWEVSGGPLVVIYNPSAGSYRVVGTRRPRRGSMRRAIKAAQKRPPLSRTRDSRPESWRDTKRRMLEDDNRCHWCGRRLRLSTATMDHVIPLARGGSNHPRNLVLACEACNQTRGHDMPELTGARGGVG